MRNILFVFLFATILTGCAASSSLTHPIEPTKEYLSNYDYGQPPVNYKKTIEEYVKSMLIDPDSAQITHYSIPSKDWLSDNDIGGNTYTGWLVCADINAKNKFGGYAGRKLYTFVFNSEKIIFSQSDVNFKMVADGWSTPNKYPINCKY